jgi:hypothetical protein
MLVIAFASGAVQENDGGFLLKTRKRLKQSDLQLYSAYLR